MAPQVEATPRVMLRKRHCCSGSSFPPKKDSSENCQISSVDLLSPEGHKFRAVICCMDSKAETGTLVEFLWIPLLGDCETGRMSQAFKVRE